MGKLRKIITRVILIGLLIYSSLLYFNPGKRFRIEVNDHNLVSTKVTEETEHIIAYGADAETAEEMYKSIRRLFSANKVNHKVRIYLAIPLEGKGKAIGKFPNGTYYVGLNLDKLIGKDIIIYNGEEWVLFHELVHFFYNHIKKAHSNEALAQFTTNFVKLNTKYELLQGAYNEIYTKYRARILSEIYETNQVS